MPRRKHKMSEDEINAELEAKGRRAEADFDDSQALFVPAKKRESILISIRLPVTMLNELRDVAIKRGDIGYQQVIKWFIAEGLSGAGAVSRASNSVPDGVVSTQSFSRVCQLQIFSSVSGDDPYPMVA